MRHAIGRSADREQREAAQVDGISGYGRTDHADGRAEAEPHSAPEPAHEERSRDRRGHGDGKLQCERERRQSGDRRDLHPDERDRRHDHGHGGHGQRLAERENREVAS